MRLIAFLIPVSQSFIRPDMIYTEVSVKIRKKGERKLNFILDPRASGLSKVLKDYQCEALRFIWKNEGKGLTSRMVHSHVNERLDGGKSISRASIINFLNAMVDEGVFDFVEEAGKGGYHRVYSAKLDEAGFKRSLAESFVSSLMKDFPEETIGVLKEYFE